MTRLCTHAQQREGKCPDCGHCEHELVLNGACYYCGETELRLSNKLGEPDIVPVENLTRRRDSDD